MATFETARRNAPRVPENTCPKIDCLSVLVDSVWADLELVEDSVSTCNSKLLRDRETLQDVKNARENLAQIRADLEVLRAENEALRDLGRYWRNAAESLATVSA